MRKAILARLAVISMTLAGACGRQPLLVWPDAGCAQSGQPDGGGGGGEAGGSTVLVQLPDGGLPSLLRDSGIVGGIMDAPRDSLLGRVVCGPEAKLGAPCSVDGQVCVLPSLGGACLCMNGITICPLDPSSGPTACPPTAQTGAPCFSPLSVCIGGGANACICRGLDYLCI